MALFRVAIGVLLASSLTACAANEPKAAAPEAELKPAEASAPLDSAKPAEVDKAPTSAPAASADSSAGTHAANSDAAGSSTTDSGAPASDAEPGRNVKYVVNPEGMRVEIEGVTFSPKAEAIKSGKGYGIKIRVEARAKDDKTHSLLAPEGTEIAIAGNIKRGGETETLSDQRGAVRELLVKPNKSVTLTRVWPSAAGLKPLMPGDEAELMIGLWGLGADASSRRPLKKFCKITVKFDKPQPRVVVGAPDGVSR